MMGDIAERAAQGVKAPDFTANRVWAAVSNPTLARALARGEEYHILTVVAELRQFVAEYPEFSTRLRQLQGMDVSDGWLDRYCELEVLDKYYRRHPPPVPEDRAIAMLAEAAGVEGLWRLGPDRPAIRLPLTKEAAAGYITQSFGRVYAHLGAGDRALTLGR